MRVEDILVLHSWIINLFLSNIFAVIFRLDETLKAMSNESVSGSQVFPTKQSGRSCSRDLVNPNIMQSAPEVGSFLFYVICPPVVSFNLDSFYMHYP